MIFFILGFIIFLLVISYRLMGKDLFAPSNLILIVFLISTICAIYNINIWKYKIRGYSTFLVISSLGIGVGVNYFFHYLYSNQSIIINQSKLHKLNSFILIIAIMLVGYCVFVQYKAIKSIGDGSFSARMHVYRLSTSYGTNTVEVNTISSRLVDLTTAITYVCVFNLVYFFRDVPFKYKILNIVEIILWVLLYFLQGSRFEVFSMIISGFVYYYFFRIKVSGKYKVYDIKKLIKLSVIGIVCLFIFYGSKDIVGRKTDKTLVEYITSYLGASIPNFDLFIKSPPESSNVLGQETFYSLVEGLKRRNIIDSPAVSFHKEFRSSNGIGLGNVYTALRDYYYDFGIIGMYMLHVIFMSFYSWLYERLKVKISDRVILICGMMYGAVFFYMFNNTFFSSYISISFVLEYLVVNLLFELLMVRRIAGKKIKFRI